MRKLLVYSLLLATLLFLGYLGVRGNRAKGSSLTASVLTDSPFVQHVVRDLSTGEISVSRLDLRRASAEELTRAEVIISTKTPPLSTTTPTLNLQAALPGQYTLPWLTPQGARNAVRTIDQFLGQELAGYRSRELQNILDDLDALSEEYDTALADCRREVLVTTLPDLDSLSFEYNLAVLHLGTNEIDTVHNEAYLRQNDLRYILFSPQAENGEFQKFLTSRDYTSLPFETLEFAESAHYLKGLRKNLVQLEQALECSGAG